MLLQTGIQNSYFCQVPTLWKRTILYSQFFQLYSLMFACFPKNIGGECIENCIENRMESPKFLKVSNFFG